jgi:hypothetical protein
MTAASVCAGIDLGLTPVALRAQQQVLEHEILAWPNPRAVLVSSQSSSNTPLV